MLCIWHAHTIYSMYTGTSVQQILIHGCGNLVIQFLIAKSHPMKTIGPRYSIQKFICDLLRSHLCTEKWQQNEKRQYLCGILSTFSPFSLLRGNFAPSFGVNLSLTVEVISFHELLIINKNLLITFCLFLHCLMAQCGIIDLPGSISITAVLK